MTRFRMLATMGLSVLCIAAVWGCQTPDPGSAATPTSSATGGVIVSTDKAEYASGGAVGITLRNELDVQLWYAQHVDCGGPFWVLQTCDGGVVDHHAFCAWEAPDHRFTALASSQELAGRWDGRVYRERDLAPAAAGCYRIMVPYSLDEPQALGEDWDEAREEAYSEPFQVQ